MTKEGRKKLFGILVGLIIGGAGAAYGFYASRSGSAQTWEEARRLLVSFGFPLSLLPLILEHLNPLSANVAGLIFSALFLINCTLLGYFFVVVDRSLLWKFVLILALIDLVGLINVIPPDKRLKPGIDLAGGTSLLYRIDTTGLTAVEQRTVAQDMIRILQQRIDPGSKRNLIWRPHGNDQIEIQMPLATKSIRLLRQSYQETREKLKANNIDLRRVRQVLIVPNGMNDSQYRQYRADIFAQLAGASPERLEMLNALGTAQDALTAGQNRRDAALEMVSAVEKKLDQAQINLSSVRDLYQDWVELDDPNRAARLADLTAADENKQQLIREYVETRMELTAARAALDGKEGEEGLQAKFDHAWDDLEALNIDLDRLEQTLDAPARTRQEELVKLKENHLQLAQQIDAFVDAYKAHSKVKGRLDDPEDLKRLLRGSGVLEFRIVPRLDETVLTAADINNYRERFERYGPTRAGDENYVWRKIKSPEDFTGGVIKAEFAGQAYVLASNMPDETMLKVKGGPEWRLQNSRPTSDNLGSPAVGFGFNEIGAGLFWGLTKTNTQRLLCILLDDEAISAPNINEPIYKSGIISGRFSTQEVLDMVDKLNAGSLPARLSDQPISQNTVGPTMGKDNLQAGLRAGIYGLISVAGFMLVYYLLGGSLADVALFMNVLLIMGVMALSRATFTMPGIAGLILTIGMAVDANVLVFERIREEQKRGSSLRMAIKNGYDRALRTILDANITTFITALILWLVASEEVKGFALILMIGIISSMFTALFVTRAVFDFLSSRRLIKDHLVMLRIIGVPKFDWMKARPVFFTISALLVTGGWVVFFTRDKANPKYAIEFTGGTSIRVVLNESGADMDRGDVEKALRQVGEKINNPLIGAARVQSIGPVERHEFEIVTTETNRLDVTLNVTGDNVNTSAALLEQAVRWAADALGDRRMADATVKSGAQPSEFIMETSQTNQNRVRSILDRMRRDLASLKYETITNEQDDHLQVKLLAAPGSEIDAEEILRRVKQAAEDLRVSKMDNATVQAGQNSGEFILTTEQTDHEKLAGVLDQTITSLSPLEYSDIATNDLVGQAVKQALGDKLDVLNDLQPQNILAEPITEELLRRKPYLADYAGGLFLGAELSGKKETLARLQERFEQGRFRSGFEQYGDNPFVLFAPDNTQVSDDELLNKIEMAVVSSEQMYGYSSAEEWEDFITKEKEKFTEILRWQTSLPRITQIDPSVGRKSMNDAMVAIALSMLAIIIYIWIRFGTLRFGMAAVVALAHDVSIALGMVAASAWLSQTTVGRALGIADFKIDLPMIAALLTLIGYSLNDTIVVFDRIRENRGKLASLSAHIINNSINQTLSRTILTSFTTVLVLIIMYIWGGAGLRDFNYVLIIGIVVGTYSSIGIASPLLFGARTEESKANYNNK